MNIKHFLSAAAALTMLAACSDYDPGESANAIDLTDAEIKTIKEYTANFVNRYGEMDPNHTWGFGQLAGLDEMGTRQSEPNSNEWVTVIKGKGQKKNDDGEPLYYDSHNGNKETTVSGAWEDWGASGLHWVDYTPVPLYDGDVPIAFERHEGAVVIPGFPVQNYYLSAQYNTEPEGDPTKPVRYTETGTPEIHQGQYHIKFPNHEGEFWFDSEEAILQYMRDNHINETEVIPLGDVASCNTLTDAEVADVYAKFSEEWHGTNPTIDLKSYYVQQIWKGTATYTYKNQDDSNGTVVGGEKMDYLVAYGENYSAGDAEHFYNFNGSNFSSGDGGMMLIYDSNTKNFAYHNSWMDEKNTNPGASTMWDHYRLVELHGNYYVGFDFESIGEYDKNIPRDHIYNDWIVKIIPGEGTIDEPDERTHTLQRRVMCEDLGETDDFDFNDVVFDVKYTRKERKDDSGNWVPVGDGTWTGQITLRASGGTLPIYIENFNGQKYECHEQMGGTKMSETLYYPINVGTNSDKDAVSLNPVSGLTDAQTDPDLINIYVYSNDGERAGNELKLPSNKGDQKFGEDLAPQKLCVPVGTRWMKERQQIEWTYDHFRDWVSDQNGEYNFGEAKDWTTYGLKDTSKLF